MKIPGKVVNGVVVLQGGQRLPEGALVTVSYEKPLIRASTRKPKRVRFPLVRSKRPGSLNLTNDRIAELLQEEDIASFQRFFPRAETD